ncbi:MAG: hypothetical protein KA123_02920 [Candidatus Eisenbacteria bacterium]|nr:hypothetical protein [Candidatus Eisenbacteria bacterium]
MPPESAAIAEEDERLLDSVAARVVRMRLAVPAIFFLESTKPLSFVGSQALVFFQPFVETFLTVRGYERFAELLEDRANLERLIRRIEALDEEERLEARDRRAEERRAKRAKQASGDRQAGRRRRSRSPEER